MATKNVFDFTQHASYLDFRLTDPALKRGAKSRFAEALRIQPAFLSQVLAEKYPLSLEQADLANQFFDHSRDEAEFFLMLVGRDRAGTDSLKKYFSGKIAQLLEQRVILADRLEPRREIDERTKGIYYSSWLYSAVHVGCSIPTLQTRRAIIEHFRISPELADSILDFLLEAGMLMKDGDRFLITQTWARVDGRSPHIRNHHTNWRMKSIDHLDELNVDELHYSGVFSADLETIEKIRIHFADFIAQQVKLIEPAPEKELFSITADVFRIRK